MRAAQPSSGATGSSALGPPLLVSTKLRPPRLREGLIERHTLVERLREGHDRTLTLVSAPAGYGKTTLLAQWEELDGRRMPFAWVSLDERDSDPVRLWSHFISGLREVTGRAGETSLAALAAGPGAIPESVLPLLVDELSEGPPLVLILDDWQTVRNPLCDQTMSSFVERAPAATQIVVSSRSDPGLPIARLRAHGELTEIRAGDLRLSATEATRLFEAAEIRLRARDVERLIARTEGWLAGLCLAVLALKRQEDPRRFVAEFSGDTRHVLDYLARDVLDAVSPETRDFMVRTSVLDRLTAPLCNAVLDTSDSAGMLAEIERANLFLVSLDEIGTAYRYHHLFAAMLKRELEATNPEAVPELHARASSWLDANGEVDAAIDHAIAGRDVPRASALVARRGPALWSSGRVTTVARWLAALSWPEAEADRVLALARSQVAGLTGRGRDELEHWLRIAEAGPDEGPLTSGIASIRCGVAMQRSGYLTRGLEAAEREARIALELEPLESPWRRVALVLLGQALYMLGRPDEARAPLEEARSLPGAEQMAPGAALGWSYLALVVLDAGDAADAERIARAALDFVEERQLAGVAAANPHLALGCALAHGPDLHAAIAHLERAVELVAPAGATYWRAHALVRLAAARHRLGEARAASDALARARADLDELPDVGMLGRLHEETAKALLSRRRREGYLGEALSEAELRILHRLAAGQSLGTVAHELWLSPNTVKTHRRSIYRKLGATTRDELLRIVGELGILEASVEKEPPAL